MELKLTSKERLVLYGLARYPGLSDIDLATMIGVDRSTIFKSKRKFRDWQLIKLLNVPSGRAVNAEIMTVVFSRYKPLATKEVRMRSQAHSGFMNHPDCVYHTFSDTDSVSILYSRSLTSFKKEFDPFMDEYRSMDFLDEVRYMHYSLDMTSYSPDACLAVNDIFELAREDVPLELPYPKESEDLSKMTEKDKLTLYSFVKYPMLSDLELSRRTGISRPTISGKRTKFLESGLLSREACIDWQKICCELITFYSIKISDVEGEEMITAKKALRKMGAPLFNYIQQGEVFGSFLSSSYPDLKKRVDSGVMEMAQQGLLEERPKLVIMPLSEIAFTKVDYAPMVARMLGITKEI
jgi:DNA-binding MarR family transcriptional regulator